MEISVETPEPVAAPVVIAAPAPEPDGSTVQLAQTVGELTARLAQAESELATVRELAESARSSATFAVDQAIQATTPEPEPEPETPAIVELDATAAPEAPALESAVAPASRRHWLMELFV